MVLLAQTVALGAAVLVVGEWVDACVAALYGAGVTLGFAHAARADLSGLAVLSGVGTLAIGQGPAIAIVRGGVHALAIALECIGATVLRALTGIADLIGGAALSGVGSDAIEFGTAIVFVVARVDAAALANDLSDGAADRALALAAHLTGGAARSLIGRATVLACTAVVGVRSRVDAFVVAQEFGRQTLCF